ncbi:MAG: ATP-binding cassette domain-containing protein [candidate division Zixibacteria bacterium]|nr:ATP-binding cassette domain-containing protein [candidate division Zixibacteria bacterium]
MSPIIRGQNVVKKYGDFTAVNNVSFDIESGSLFGFLGPNGAGKTTIMKMIYCFVTVTSGRLTVDGKDVMQNPRGVKEILGVVPQEDNLDPDLTTYENLLTYARYYGIPKRIVARRAEELLDFVSLDKKDDSPVEELSGGMKRRLTLARGLINEPRILILDEPTTGLDPQARHLVWQKMRELKRRGITILLTTHYMEEAAYLCDELVLIDHGEFIARGNPDDLIKELPGESVVELHDVRNEDKAKIESRLNDYENECFGDTIYVYADSSRKVMDNLNGFTFARVIERKTNLEDLFLRLTGRSLRD